MLAQARFWQKPTNAIRLHLAWNSLKRDFTAQLIFENFVILSPFLADSFTALNPSMSSD